MMVVVVAMMVVVVAMGDDVNAGQQVSVDYGMHTRGGGESA